jgi:uncharacterized integral membrane protein
MIKTLKVSCYISILIIIAVFSIHNQQEIVINVPVLNIAIEEPLYLFFLYMSLLFLVSGYSIARLSNFGVTADKISNLNDQNQELQNIVDIYETELNIKKQIIFDKRKNTNQTKY